MFQQKQRARTAVWNALEEEGGAVSVSPHGRIPNFAGAERAGERLFGHDPVPVATTVHPLQVVEQLPRDAHDAPLSLIVPPGEAHVVDAPPPVPDGIDWDLLPEDAFEEMPVLRNCGITPATETDPARPCSSTAVRRTDRGLGGWGRKQPPGRVPIPLPIAVLSSPMQTRAPVLRPEVFSDVPAVSAGMSTRHGGVSGPPYDTLNLGRHVGDDPSSVEENRRRFCAALDTDPAWLATAGQVHSTTVRVIDAPRHEPFCDGLVTTTPELLLAVAAADCAPVLLADPEHGVVGACHAGWRGTVAGIVPGTIDAMTTLGATPGTLRAHVGPCISLESFEVGPEVAARFDDAVVHRRDGWARPHVDLKAALRRQLEDAGLSPDAIEVSGRCTATETDAFFSHRAAGGPTGRMFGAVVLRN